MYIRFKMTNKPPKLSKVLFVSVDKGLHRVYHLVVNEKIYHNNDYMFDMLYAKIVNGKNILIMNSGQEKQSKMVCFEDNETANQFLKAMHYCVTREHNCYKNWTFVSCKVLFYSADVKYLSIKKDRIEIDYDDEHDFSGFHAITFDDK